MNSDFVVAVHALVFLHHKQQTLSSDELAENICTNPVRVRRILSKLCKAGLLEGKRGQANGGYYYRKTQTITLNQVSEIFGGRFADLSWTSGDSEDACPICSGMAGYMSGIYDELNRRCAEYLGTITIADIEHNLINPNHSTAFALNARKE